MLLAKLHGEGAISILYREAVLRGKSMINDLGKVSPNAQHVGPLLRNLYRFVEIETTTRLSSLRGRISTINFESWATIGKGGVQTPHRSSPRGETVRLRLSYNLGVDLQNATYILQRRSTVY